MRAQTFRKKPVQVEAIPVREALDYASHDWSRLPKWLRDAYDNGEVLFLPSGVEIVTLEGRMTGQLEDWIIQGVQGELYPCKPDVFAATYEPVEVPDVR